MKTEELVIGVNLSFVGDTASQIAFCKKRIKEQQDYKMFLIKRLEEGDISADRFDMLNSQAEFVRMRFVAALSNLEPQWPWEVEEHREG